MEKVVVNFLVTFSIGQYQICCEKKHLEVVQKSLFVSNLNKYLPAGDLNERGTSPQWRFSYHRDKIFFAFHFDFL